jgi:hypothetical protein
MIFSAFNFSMDQKLVDGNKKQSFAPLPTESNGQNRSMGAQKIIPPDSANSRHMCTICSSAEPSGTPHSSQIKKDQPQKVSIFA